MTEHDPIISLPRARARAAFRQRYPGEVADDTEALREFIQSGGVERLLQTLRRTPESRSTADG